MAKILFANNASSLLTTGINDSDSTLTITAGSETLFPTITTVGDYFMVTIVHIDGDYEIVRVTATSNNTFTIERAQEGTTARAFAIDSLVENRLTAASLETALNSLPTASETEAGIIRIATDAEAEEGVLTDVAVTPKHIAEFSGGAGKIICEIFTASVPHGYSPEGATRTSGIEFTDALFPDVIEMYKAGKLLGMSYTDWDAQVSEFGRCAAFAIDEANGKFRVPLLKDGDSLTVAMSELEVGKNYKAGLPNITGSLTPGRTAIESTGIVSTGSEAPTGAFTAVSVGTRGIFASGTVTSSTTYRGALDASRSSSVYGNSTTVQTEQARLPYFVQIANGSVNESLMDWSAFMQALDGKLDKSSFNNSIDYVVVYGTGKAPVGDSKAIESAALGNNGIVSVSSRYVVANPFESTDNILVIAQIKESNNVWYETGWAYSSAAGGSYGTSATVSQSSSALGKACIVQTGTLGVRTSANASGGGHGVTGVTASAECRVIIWKLEV